MDNKNNEAIQHLINARNQFSQAEEQIQQVAGSISSTSEKFEKTNQTYSNYKSTIQKSGLYVTGLTKQHKINIIMVYGSFFFLVLTVGFIMIRRLFYKTFYQDVFQFILNPGRTQDL